MPYSDAVGLCGGEAELRAAAKSRQTLWGWRERGVPWHVVGPVLLKRRQDDGQPADLPDLAHLLADVRRIYAAGHDEVILALRQNLHVFLMALRPGQRRRRVIVQRVGDILVARGRVRREHVDEALDEQRRQAEGA